MNAHRSDRPAHRRTVLVALVALALLVPALGSATDAPEASAQAAGHEAADFASEVHGNPFDFADADDSSGMMVVHNPPGRQPEYEFPTPAGGDLAFTARQQSQLYVVRDWGAGALATGRDGPNRPIDADRYRWVSFEATLPAGTPNTAGGVFWSTCQSGADPCNGGRPFTMRGGRHVYNLPVHQGPIYNGTAAWQGTVENLVITPNASPAELPIRFHWIRIHAGPASLGSSWVPPAPEPSPGGRPVVDARPRPVVTDPDVRGDQDYAATVRGGNAWDFDQLADVALWVNANLSASNGRLHGSTAGPTPNDPAIVLAAPQPINTRRWHRLSIHLGYSGDFGLHDDGGGGMVGRFVWRNPALPGHGIQETDDIVVFPGHQVIELDLHTDPPSAVNDDDIPYRAGWGAVGSMVVDTPRWDPHEDRAARNWYVDHIKLARNDLANPTFAVRFRDGAWEPGTTARLFLVDRRGAGGGQALHGGTLPVVEGTNSFTLDARNLADQGVFWVRLELTDPGGATTTAWSSGPVETSTPVEFIDVDPRGSFMRDVSWVVKERIADGYDQDTFGSTRPVSRQAMAAFLRRLLGPADPPPCTAGQFPDVGAGHRFCADIAWLVAAGITEGYSDGTFRPTAPVSRQAMAAFLHRAVEDGQPPACTGRPFPDVAAATAFCGHIAWLSGTGITGGYPDGTYRPTVPVSRQAMARFLRLVDDLG